MPNNVISSNRTSRSKLARGFSAGLLKQPALRLTAPAASLSPVSRGSPALLSGNSVCRTERLSKRTGYGLGGMIVWPEVMNFAGIFALLTQNLISHTYHGLRSCLPKFQCTKVPKSKTKLLHFQVKLGR